MAKSFICLEEKKYRINKFSIGYIINPTLNINKSFKEKVTKYMKTTFGAITKPHIRTILAKKNIIVLSLLMFYETIKNPKKFFRVLSCFIYTIIINYVCIDYLSSESKKISELPFYYGGGFKHENKSHDKMLGIGIPDLLINLMSCGGVLENMHSIFILNIPKRILEYYFSKGFTLFDNNTNNLSKISNEVKVRIHVEDTDNSDKVMICSTTIPST